MSNLNSLSNLSSSPPSFSKSQIPLNFSGLLPWIQGEFSVELDWHKPYWGVFECLAFHGREDKALFGFSSQCNRYVAIQAKGGGHSVGISETQNGFSSYLANAEIFVNLNITNPIVALNYGFDAEYVQHQAEKQGICVSVNRNNQYDRK